MTRPYNFSAGPAALPEAVLRQAAGEMLDWHGSGMGVMEMSHRGREFMSIAQAAEAGLLLSVTADKVIRLVPPLIFSEADVAETLRILVPLVKQALAAPAA